MPTFVIPDSVKDKGIDEVGFRSDIVEYLREHGYRTVRDIVDNQKNIPNTYLTPIKAKLIFNLDV